MARAGSTTTSRAGPISRPGGCASSARRRQRIAEDYLRILRFFRFFAHYGRPPADPEALAACRAAAPELRRLSGERIQAEMLRLLAAPDPLPALRLMAETGVLDQVIPGAVALERLARLIEVGARERAARSGSPPCSGRRPPGPKPPDRVVERWHLSNRDADRLLAMTASALPGLRASPAGRRRDLHRLGKRTLR